MQAKKRILVIDDEPCMLDMLQEWLELNGHQVTTAATADILWLSGLPLPFDLVITDRWHPGMDGLQLAQLLKDIGGPPVIIASGWPDNDGGEAKLAGAVAFLKKPVNLKELLAIIESSCQ